MLQNLMSKKLFINKITLLYKLYNMMNYLTFERSNVPTRASSKVTHKFGMSYRFAVVKIKLDTWTTYKVSHTII